jgi:GTPase SAR1 family protein
LTLISADCCSSLTSLHRLEHRLSCVCFSLCRDLAGQDRFQGLARIYYRDAVGAFVVFDVMSRRSFESAKRWKEDIDQKVFLRDGARIPVVLLGNKV